MNEQLDLFLSTNQDMEKATNRNVVKENECVEVEQVELTIRQKQLYWLIEHNSLVEHRKTTQREIYDKLQRYGYEWNDDEKTHDHCSAIWNDIASINENVYARKLIISKDFEYWIGSERENQEYIKSLWRALAPRLHRYWKYLKKTMEHGQYTFIDANGKLIDDKSKAQRFIQAFNDYDIEMQEESNKGDK